MEKITTVGIDLAKQVMAVCAMDAEGRMVMRKVLRRDQVLRWTATLPQCVVAMEACGGAHYWARELTQQRHTVRIIAAELVQAFRKHLRAQEVDRWEVRARHELRKPLSGAVPHRITMAPLMYGTRPTSARNRGSNLPASSRGLHYLLEQRSCTEASQPAHCWLS
jgi:hypothetical protein